MSHAKRRRKTRAHFDPGDFRPSSSSGARAAVTSTVSAKARAKAAKQSKRTKEEKKELALLVHLKRVRSARAVERIAGFGSGDGSSLLYWIVRWRKKDKEMRAVDKDDMTLDDLATTYAAKWCELLPALFPAVTAVASAGEPAVNMSLDLEKAKWATMDVMQRKRLAQIAAIEYRKRNNCSWAEACKEACAKLKEQNCHVTLNTRATARVAKKLLANPEYGVGSIGRRTFLPPAIEEGLAWTVCYMRSQQWPVYKACIMELANKACDALGASCSFKDGIVTDAWYRGFKKRHVLVAENEEGIDVRRADALTSKNLFKSFLKMAAICVEVGVAVHNPKWVSPEDTPEEPPINWINEELWRVMEFDENRQDIGKKTAQTKKTREEMVVGRRGGGRRVLRDGVPLGSVSMMMAINFAYETLQSGCVFNCGPNVSLGHIAGLLDDEGNAFTTRCTGFNGQVEEIEVFYASNDKGSFDGPTLLAYLKSMVTNTERMHTKFTPQKKGLLYIDGCQTHLLRMIVEWCNAHHIEVVIKLPYGSSELQSMDAKGGHFRQVGSAYRRNVSIRSAQRKRDYANAFDTTEAKAIGTTLKFYDFVPMMRKPWRMACTEERHRVALRVVGVRPTFTMSPAYKILKEEQRLAKIESELTTVNLAADPNNKVVEGLEGLKVAVIDKVRTKRKPRKKLRNAVVAGAIRMNGGEGASSSSSSTLNSGHIVGRPDGSALAGSKRKRKKKMTRDEKGFAAGRQSIISCTTIDDEEKRRLLVLANKNGTFSNCRSGGVFEHFSGNPTGNGYRAWLAAVQTKEMAIAADSARLAVERGQRREEKIAAERARCVDVRARLVAEKWTDEAIKRCNKLDLVALLRVDGGYVESIKLDGIGMKKSTVVMAGQPFFLRMRSALPRERRTNAGKRAARLEDD